MWCCGNGGKRHFVLKHLVDNIKTYFCIKFKDNGKRYNSYKSLDEFCTKFSDRIMNKYVIYTKDYKRENGVDYIPVYMTMFL